MSDSGRRGYGKLSIMYFITVTVVGQETVVVIGKQDFAWRSALRKSRHNGTSFQLVTKQRVASQSSCQARDDMVVVFIIKIPAHASIVLKRADG
jgi:hypothetical protein